MERYLLLFKFTDKGIAGVKDSPQRAQAFKETAAKAGATVEWQLWTTGDYDGALLLSAPNGNVAATLALGLGRLGNVRTTMLRAFDGEQFRQLLQ